MQMKRIFSMTFGFVAAMSMAMAFCFAGCASLFSFNGKFQKEEIMLSVGEEFLPSDYFSTDRNIEFFVEDDSILTKNDTGEFSALRSGKTTLIAKSGDLIIDSVRVYVKYSFQTPTNINVTCDGLVSWDSSAIVLDGKTIRPTYKILINDAEYDAPTNEYQLSQSGIYTIKVKANSTSRVNGSPYSNEITFSYDTIAGATKLKFISNESFGAQTGILSWEGGDSGVLTIDNIQQDVSGYEKLLNFASYTEKSAIDAKLLLKSDGCESKTQTKTITKLYTQEVSVKNNEIYWLASNNVKCTLIRVVNAVTGDVEIVRVSSNVSVLEGLGEGIYTISNQAIAQEGFANGNVKRFAYQLGKIKNVDAVCTLEGKTLKVTFSTTSEFNKKFAVKQNGVVSQFEFAGEKVGGKYTLTHDFELNSGLNTFTVQAYPTLGDGEFEFGGKATKLAIKSDEEKIFSAYNLDRFSAVTHSTDEQGNSILSFDTIEYANAFDVKINNTPLNEKLVNIGESQTTINVGKITKAKYGDSQRFNIELKATRSPAQNEVVSPSVTYKTLTMLSQPAMSNCAGGQNTNNNTSYSWQKDGRARYVYELYSTDESFDIADVAPFTENVLDAKTRTLTAGYYVVKVRALPLDENKYLASEEIGQDKFYFTEQIESPAIRLDYTEGLSSEYSGYVLKIKTVEFGYEYKVLYGESETNLGSIYNTSELDELSFNLPASVTLTDTKQIKVVAIANGSALQTIHSNVTSTLTIEKLSAPTEYSIIENNSKIEIKNDDSQAVMQIFKNGVMIAQSERGQNAVADISTFDGEFAVQARYAGYDEFDGYTTNGTTKISSDFASFTLHRSQTPFNLVYNGGIISFEHNDQAEKYVVSIEVESTNGAVQKTFEPAVSSNETTPTKKSFNLESEIASLRSNDEQFNSIFTQKTKITLSLHAYISQEIGGKYYISSFDATAKHDSEQRQIVISKLDPVSVEYDYDRKVIFWDGDASLNPVYDIYLDSVFKATIKTKSASGKYEYDISSYDFSLAGEYKFYIVASSDNALSSDKSKNIVIRKIAQVEKLDIIEKTDGYYAKFAFAAGDEGHIDDVIVNDKSIDANVEFKLTSDATTIVIKGENYIDANGDKIFYISSEKSNFTISQLKLNSFAADVKIENAKILWNDYATENASEWSLTSPASSVRYLVEIYDASTMKTKIVNIAANSVNLDDENLLNLEKGEYTLKLYAYITEYEISNGGSGYFGKVLLQENVSVTKLAQVKNLEISMDDTQGTIADELEKDVVLSWEYDDVGTSTVTFKIFINDSLKTTTAEKTYTLSQTDFGKTENIISVVAVSNKDISSNKTDIKLAKYAQPEISIDDRGMLEITDKDVPAVSAGYIIEVTMKNSEGDSQTSEYYTTSRTYDLSQASAGINQRSGEIKVRVIQRVCHTGVNAIPTIAAEANKTVLAAPTITQTASGFTISSTDDGVTYYVKCVGKNYDEKVEGSTFVYPDEWEGGEYEFIVYAQRKDVIDSWKNEPITINVDRVDAASSVKFTLDDNYLDYTLLWDSITDASSYEIEVFANSVKIGNTLIVNSNSVKLSQIREIATDFKSGDYTLSLRSLTNFTETARTNSMPFTFSVSVAENTVDNVEISEDGKLSFTSNNKESFYIVTKQTDSAEEFGELVEASVNEYAIPKYAGKLQISIVQINTSTSEQTATSTSGVSINAAAVVANVTKLQDILSIEMDQTSGKITINVNVEADENNRKFVVSYKGDEKNLNVVKNGSSYEFLAIEMVNLFSNVSDGEFNFSIISLIDGNVRSNALEEKIGYSNHNNSSMAVKQDEINDFIILTGDEVESATANATAIHIRVDEKAYCEAPVFGYWIENKNLGVETPKYFSSTAVAGANITSVRCCAVNISNLLENFDAGQINVKVGFISTHDGLFTVTNYSEIYEYKKLEAVATLQIDNGNFKWSNTGEENTAFMLFFDGDTQHKTAKISASSATYYLGENVSMTEEFSAAIKVVSAELKVVPSKKTNYKSQGVDAKISQLAQIESEMSLTDGVIKLEFNTTVGRSVSGSESVEKKYKSIEEMLENRTSSTDFPTITNFAEQLISNRLTQPFSFRLEKLEDVTFNLKFVERVASSGIKKSYYTSIKATNILSSLKPETLAEIYIAFTDNNITNPAIKVKLDNVYKMLTNSDYFSGIASSTLLFREIGDKEIGEYGFYPAMAIPVGEYDIYIQQMGSAEENTISSQYKLAKQGVNVVNSPVTRTDSEEIAGGETNIYYAKFAPISGKNDYTIALRDKVAGEIIEYKVSKSGDEYLLNMFSGDTKSLKFESGFVWIPLNGENGLIYDTSVTNIHGNDIVVKESKRKDSLGDYTQIADGRKFGGTSGIFAIDSRSFAYTIENGNVSIAGVEVVDGEFTIDDIVYSVIQIGLVGHDFTVDIYANGDSKNINGKSETISVTFLKFNIDTLRLKDGKFVWQNFVVNSKIYPSTVVTKQTNTEATVSTRVASAQGGTASFTPEVEGSYDSFKFFTKGETVGFEIRVDSDVYVIENLYKLKRPKIEVSDGALVVVDNTAALDKRTSKNFILSNDVSEKKEQPDAQTLVVSDIEKDSNGKFLLQWRTGLNGLVENTTSGVDALFNYRKTEQTAIRFDAAVSGDDFSNEEFVITANNIGKNGGYYSVSIPIRDAENPILLQSQKANVDAAKLAYESDSPAVEIEDGNIKWSQVVGSVSGETIEKVESRNEGDLEVLYEVVVDFYYETSSAWNKHSSLTLYSNSNSLRADNIIDPISGVEFKYVITVRANVYAYTTGTADVTTIENIKYKKIANTTYDNEDYFNSSTTGKLILDGESLKLGYETRGESGQIIEDNLIGRTKQVENFKINVGENVYSGMLAWEYDLSNDVDFRVFAINNSIKKELKGEAKNVDETYNYVFNIDEGELLVGKRYNFEVIAYKKTPKTEENIEAQAEEELNIGEISSLGVRLRSQEDVRVLPNLTSNDYEIEEISRPGGVENVISFKEYFSKYGEEYNNSMVIRVEKTIGVDTQFINKEENYEIGDINDSVKVFVRAVPSVGDRYLMSGSSYEIMLDQVEWSAFDNYYYDSNSHTIYWTFGVEEAYQINNVDGAEIYICTQENNSETVIYPFGVRAGERISASALMLLIDYYDENEAKVDGAYVKLAQVDISNGKVAAKDGQDAVVFGYDGTEIGVLEAGNEYELSTQNYKRRTINPATGEEKDYYLPADVISYNGENAVTTKNSAFFVDKNCTKKETIENGTNVEGLSSLGDDEYQYIGEIDANGMPINGYYLKTQDILKCLVQKDAAEEDISNVTFKVSFTTEYSYDSNGAHYAVTDKRDYNNVPIGELITEKFNGITVGTQGIRVTKFEFPIAGKIKNIEIRARKNENNLASASALKGSELGSKIVDMNLFALGEGTEINPYVINTKAQFENMKYRLDKPTYLLSYNKSVTTVKTYNGKNTTTKNDATVKETSTTYYFKQTSDISTQLSGFAISQAFNGVYDGNGKTISVEVVGIENLEESEYVTAALPASSGYDDGQVFKKGAALFKTVGENGTIKNLKLNFSVTISSQFSQSIVAEKAAGNDTGKALVSGLVFKNLGLVDAVSVSASSVTFNSALQQSGTLAVAPIVGENRKNANGLVSQANVSITNNNKSGSQNFYYGGLVGFHNAGTMQFAKSSNSSSTAGNINVNFTSNQNGIVAVGGIAITARSTIDMALNAKNISVVASGANTFAGGIVALGVSAKLYSCVNTADVSASHAGGIAYAFYNTSVSTLVGLGTVNKKVQYLFAEKMSFASSSTSERVYSYSTYKPTGSFTLSTINGSANIICKDHPTYKIAVTVTSNTYSADIINTK